MVNLATVVLVTNVFRIVAILLHGLGTYLLVCLYREGLQAPEKILLINLSVSEILFNFFDLLSTPRSAVDSTFHTLGEERIITNSRSNWESLVSFRQFFASQISVEWLK